MVVWTLQPLLTQRTGDTVFFLSPKLRHYYALRWWPWQRAISWTEVGQVTRSLTRYSSFFQTNISDHKVKCKPAKLHFVQGSSYCSSRPKIGCTDDHHRRISRTGNKVSYALPDCCLVVIITVIEGWNRLSRCEWLTFIVVHRKWEHLRMQQKLGQKFMDILLSL